MNPRASSAALACASVLLCTACSASATPANGDSATSSRPVLTTAVPTGPMKLSPGQGFESSNAFAPQFTCDDPHDYSPGLRIANVPAGTGELALSMVDVTTPKIHWLQLGLPGTTTILMPHTLTAGAREALNDFGEATYDGPCPPKGTAHTYRLTLYAFRDAVPTRYGKDTPPRQTLLELQKQALSTASLTATYTRR